MATTLKVIALLLNEGTAKEVESAVCRVKGVDMSTRMVDEGGHALTKVGSEEMPDVIILEINGQREDDINDIENIVAKHGERITVFVTTKGDDMTTMRRLMRAGVKDVFPQPLPVQEVVMAVSKAIADKRKHIMNSKGGRGCVAAFLNAKGGSGATTLSVNSAYALSFQANANVALIDLDIQFGTAATFLDLNPRSNVMDALQQPERLDPIFLRALMTRHECGLEVLASPGELSSIEDIQEGAVTRLLEAAVESYDFVIIDMPRLYTPWTLAAMKFVNPLMVVVQNDVATLRDAKLLLDQLPLRGVPAKNIEVVNNRALSKMHNISIEHVKQTLNIKRVHRVRNDYEAAVKAQDSGVPLIQVAKHSHTAKDLKVLAENLSASRIKDKDEKKGFIGKLFGHAN